MKAAYRKRCELEAEIEQLKNAHIQCCKQITDELGGNCETAIGVEQGIRQLIYLLRGNESEIECGKEEYQKLSDQNDYYVAEIERLEAKIEKYKQSHYENRQEIERLEVRVEMTDSKGNRVPDGCDGIDCRNETIRLQDQKIERLENHILHLLGECPTNCKFCGE
jgi:chromosome segregation ATPase